MLLHSDVSGPAAEGARKPATATDDHKYIYKV